MSKEREQTGDDDLFEFDELVEEQAPMEPRPDAPGVEPVEALFSPADAGSKQPVELDDDLEEEDELEHENPAPVVIARNSLPPIVVPLLLVMVVANLALVGLTWRSSRIPRELTLPVEATRFLGDERSGELGGNETGKPERKSTLLRREVPSLASSRDDAWAILDEAQRSMDVGDFVDARRAMYSMLSVIDRVEAAERPDLESRAGYLIAESYRRQAEELGRDPGSPDGGPR